MTYTQNKSVSEYFEAQASDLEEIFAGQVRMMQLREPDRQYKPLPDRRYKADFAWPAQKIIVEIEGGIYADDDRAKGHAGGAAYERNCEKYNLLTIDGWRVLRGGPNQVKNGELARHLLALMLGSIQQ